MVEYNKQIADIEAEIRKAMYNKATQHHIGEVIARSPFFGLGLYGVRPCVARVKPVDDVADVYLPPLWIGGGR